MTRVTTPKHEFILEIDPREWDEFFITYKQAGVIVLERTEQDNVTMEAIEGQDDKYKISFYLTQEETKQFRPNVKCEMQIRCHYPEGHSYASEMISLEVHDVLNDEILGEEDED